MSLYRNRKQPLISKSTDDMFRVPSVVGDMVTIDSSLIEVTTTSCSSVGSVDDKPSESGIRKRKRLDHLSLEEKDKYRKMKNRISARSARERRKTKMYQQEITIESLVLSNEDLKSENSALNSKCYTLSEENERLTKLLKEYKEKMIKLESSVVQEV